MKIRLLYIQILCVAILHVALFSLVFIKMQSSSIHKQVSPRSQTIAATQHITTRDSQKGVLGACTGIASSTKPTNNSYKSTAFGCYVDASGNRNNADTPGCIAWCGNVPGECDGLSEVDCMYKVKWFVANKDQWGCFNRLKITNPANGKSVIAVVYDQGPACSRVNTYGEILDMSYPTALYLGVGDYQDVTVEPVSKDTPLGPTDGSSSTPPTGNSAGAGGGTFSLSLVLKPKDRDSYVMNTARADIVGGAGASTGPNLPPGTTDGNCTPTGPYPSDLSSELKNTYHISLDGYAESRTKDIYNLLTCLSKSRLPSLLPSEGVTIHNANRPPEYYGGIGMWCFEDRTCGVWIPDITNAFKFILTHELGHIIYYSNTREAMHVTEFDNAFTVEKGLSPYSRRDNGCEKLGTASREEDYAENVAYYLNPQGGRTGACDPGTGPLNPLYETNNYPLHISVAKQVL